MRKGLAFIILWQVFFAINSFSQAGILDSSFGVNGRRADNDFNYYSPSLAIQKDGKIIVAGNSSDGSNPGYFLVKRYKNDGTVDLAFGNNGIVKTYFDNSENITSSPTSVIIQPDGKIVVGGDGFNPAIETDRYLVARYLSNGTLDSTFGIGGKSSNKIANAEEGSGNLKLQSDGKILFGGTCDGYCLLRYTLNGNLDSSFSNDGVLVDSL